VGLPGGVGEGDSSWRTAERWCPGCEQQPQSRLSTATSIPQKKKKKKEAGAAGTNSRPAKFRSKFFATTLNLSFLVQMRV
jgi:hypothetical protein